MNNTKQIKAVIAGEEVLRFLCVQKMGEIVMVSHKGWYLSFDEKIFLLHDKDCGIVPFGIGISDFEKTIPYSRNFEKSMIIYDHGRIFLPPNISVDIYDVMTADVQQPLYSFIKVQQYSLLMSQMLMDSKKSWMPFLLKDKKEIMRGNISKKNHTSLNENAYIEKTYLRLAGLFLALNNGSYSDISQAVYNLVGIGSGLTPSTDDWLVGFTYSALKLCDNQEIHYLCESIKSHAETRTNNISATYLKSASNGYYFEVLDRVIHSPNEKEISNLLSIGSSSGADMLTGIIFALEYIRDVEKM